MIISFAAMPMILGAGAAYFLVPRKEKPKGSHRPIIVCIGDSITFGHGVLLTRNRDAWPRILERNLNPRYDILNFGFSGATLLNNGDRPYPPDFWAAAKARRAELYVLMLGSNDSKPYNWNAEQYAKQLEMRVRELQEVPSAKRIVLMAPPPAFKRNTGDLYAAFNIDPTVIRDEIRIITKTTADRCGVEFIDLYAKLDGHCEYMKDGVHPNRQGNEVIAAYLAEQLQMESRVKTHCNNIDSEKETGK